MSGSTKMIAATHKGLIADALRELLGDNGRLHATNGTYAYPQDMILPTMLSGFQFVNDWFLTEDDLLLIAVNSDKSMQSIYDAKNTPLDEREDEQTRAMKVAQPLQEHFTKAKVMVVFYDEDTPTALYSYLKEQGLPLRTLHKWGYGTDPSAPKIEGADLFDITLAFPLPNDTKPLCYDLTAHEDQSAKLEIYDLREEYGYHGAAYLRGDNKVLFPVPASLQVYAAPRDERPLQI